MKYIHLGTAGCKQQQVPKELEEKNVDGYSKYMDYANKNTKYHTSGQPVGSLSFYKKALVTETLSNTKALKLFIHGHILFAFPWVTFDRNILHSIISPQLTVKSTRLEFHVS
ncbi:hypothetical protein [Peribacillus sp. NJ4]|uniref:hypothetical protein n=1 Tax=Peribacillus sp. NJ4 TaxID=3055862 RepID=UPI0025A304C1|nr:hypothetical protein [Peribacillus sp. NJ4]